MTSKVNLEVNLLDVTSGCGGEGACPRQSDGENSALFLRISSWSYNTELGFHYLANVLNRNTCFSQEHLLLGNASKGANLLRHQFLQTWEHTERLFSALKTRALFIREEEDQTTYDYDIIPLICKFTQPLLKSLNAACFLRTSYEDGPPPRAERLRHHLIFYYGHTATFFVNKLFASGLIRHQDRINPKVETSGRSKWPGYVRRAASSKSSYSASLPHFLPTSDLTLSNQSIYGIKCCLAKIKEFI